MESWVLGYDGDEDVERHAALEDAPRTPVIRVRVVSDYI